MDKKLKEALDILTGMDVDVLKANVVEMKAESDQEKAEAQLRLQKQVNLAIAKLRAIQDDIQVRIETSVQETDVKIKSFPDQAAKDRDEQKAKVEARIAEFQADQKQHGDQLKQEWEKIKKDLSD